MVDCCQSPLFVTAAGTEGRCCPPTVSFGEGEEKGVCSKDMYDDSTFTLYLMWILVCVFYPGLPGTPVRRRR